MSCLPRPAVDGVYRIKIKNQDRYFELDSNGRIKLVPREEAEDGQLWRIVPLENGTFKITNELKNHGLTYKTASNAGHSHPLVREAKGSPSYWTFSEGSIGYQKFSKISVIGDSSGHVLDSSAKSLAGLGTRWVHFSPPDESHENQRFEFEMGRSGYPPCVDLLFLQDTTGSQGAYIAAAISGIERICQKVSAVGKWGKGDIRMGLIAFRDHPPQDSTYVTQEYEFTTEINTMQANLRKLDANGGGDGPEASTAALDSALKADWRDDGAKIAILITDAPPHGIGANGDGIPDGDPQGRDPIQIARKLARAAVTLYVLACEPELSSYTNALDFYRGLVSITGGTVVPLTNPDKLADLVITHAQEAIQVENLISIYGDDVAFQSRRPGFSIQHAAAELLDRLHRDGVCLDSVDDEDVYAESKIGDQNVEIWAGAQNIIEARNQVSPTSGYHIKAHGSASTEQSEPRPPTLSQAERLVKQILKRNS